MADKNWRVGEKFYRKKRTAWYCKLEGPAGEREERKLLKGPNDKQTGDDAEKERQKLREQIEAHGTPTLDCTVDHLVQSFLTYVEANNAQGTYRNYAHFLLSFAESPAVVGLKVRDLELHHANDWLAKHYPIKGNKNTRHDAIAALKRLFNWAVNDMKYLPYSPLAGLRKPKRTHRDLCPTMEQWNQVLAHYAGDPFGDFLSVLVDTGARPQELRVAEARQLDLRAQPPVIVFDEGEIPGKEHGRKVQLTPRAAGILTRLADAKNPGCVISTKPLSTLKLLGTIAQCYQGTSTGDNPRFVLCFWELPGVQEPWERFQVAPEQTEYYGGRQHVISWREVQGNEGAAIRGDQAWGRSGIAIGQMRGLPATLYRGERFSNTTPVIVPDNEDDLSLLWHFCTSPEFFQSLRDLNPKLSVDNGYVGKIGIDVQKWADTAGSQEPLPEPYSNDASQWLFHGRPEQSTTPLQVAAARLVGYRWPAEPQEQAAGGEHKADGGMRLSASTKELVKRCDELLKAADDDGVVCIPAVRSESPAAERFREVLHVAYDPKWSSSLLHDLLADAGCRPGTTLDDWLRNAFFEEHCKQFHNRPFIWQVWDGHKEGFSCLLNYHKLTYKTLDNLTHAYLETWIKKQAGDAKTGKTGADLRLAAAQGLQEKLKLILAGEPPYDIFVRWKPLQKQPIGWNPDLNDGVRVNIRPFVEAGILRKNPNIKWTKDRGKEPARDKDEYPWFWKGKAFTGDRVNDVHLTNADKQTARAARGVK